MLCFDFCFVYCGVKGFEFFKIDASQFIIWVSIDADFVDLVVLIWEFVAEFGNSMFIFS